MAELKTLYHRWLHWRHPLTDALWQRALNADAYSQTLPRNDRQRLRALITDFLRQKSFDGVAGLEVKPTMRAVVALKACIPVLNLGLNYYAEWATIVMYPGDFRVRHEYLDDNGVVHQETADLCGESLSQGPMVLSWDTVFQGDDPKQGQNLVIHECAHKLDILNGAADGYPPLHRDMDTKLWAREFSTAYEWLRQAIDDGRETRLDSYAGSDPAEFFAVVSETFFTVPEILLQDFPAIYNQLTLFYRQDPYPLLQSRKNAP
jgi:MtfA peptidase